MAKFDFTSIVAEKAEAPEKKDYNVTSGPKARQLSDTVTEKINTGEWFSAPNLPDGKEAKAFIYAVRQTAKKLGKGLQVKVDEPDILLKDLTTDTPGPITVRISAANPLDTRKGRKNQSMKGQSVTVDVTPSVPTEAEKEAPTSDSEMADEVSAMLADLTASSTTSGPSFKSPPAFVDPDAPTDHRDVLDTWDNN